MISVKDLHKSFGTQQVLKGLTLEVERGKVVGILGPSGTGKSVLLKIMIGLLEADAGEVLIDGESMTGTHSAAGRLHIAERMGVLFQGAALFDSLSLIENVAFPLLERKVASKDEAWKRSTAILKEVGLSGYELAYPGEVSIGMRKRVGIARALVTEPDILLFDEPNTGLDPQMGQEIYELIVRMHKEFSFTGLVVSHEIPEVFQVCDEVLVMYKGEVQQRGSAEEIMQSTHPVVNQFIEGRVDGPIQMN